MNILYSSGNSVLTVLPAVGKGRSRGGFTVSIVSRRAARFILRQSQQRKWSQNYARLVPSILMGRTRILLVGFCGSSGYHLAVVEDQG